MSDTPTILARDLAADLGSPVDAIEWLEDQLAGCDDEGQALALCQVINAAEVLYRGHLH